MMYFILKTKISSKLCVVGGDQDERFSCDLNGVFFYLFKTTGTQMRKEIIASHGLALTSTGHLH